MVVDRWGEAEEVVRQALVHATGTIPDEEIAGFVFGLGLIVSDHIFRFWKWIL